MSAWFAFAPLTLSLLACGGGPAAPTPAALDEPFVLAPGEAALVEGRYEVHFDGVAADSRCPSDVVCVTAGDARIGVRVKRGSGRGPESMHELHTGPDGTPREVELGTDRTLQLVALAPYPRSTVTTRPQDYRATLRVSARQ